MAILQEAELWVGVGLVLFFALLVWLKVPNMATKALDARAAKIQAALDEALRLRDEAGDLLASIKARHQQAQVQIAEMLKEVDMEAKRLEAEAQIKLTEQITRRTALADQRIATAEAQAAQEVKAAAAELAAEMAETMLKARIASVKSDPLVASGIEELAHRLR